VLTQGRRQGWQLLLAGYAAGIGSVQPFLAFTKRAPQLLALTHYLRHGRRYQVVDLLD
jgi:hypothetical protein